MRKITFPQWFSEPHRACKQGLSAGEGSAVPAGCPDQWPHVGMDAAGTETQATRPQASPETEGDLDE